MTRLVAIVALLLLSGCPSVPARVTTGEAVMPPGGFVILCSGKDAGPECGK